jgi:hypothetical protein
MGFYSNTQKKKKKLTIEYKRYETSTFIIEIILGELLKDMNLRINPGPNNEYTRQPKHGEVVTPLVAVHVIRTSHTLRIYSRPRTLVCISIPITNSEQSCTR